MLLGARSLQPTRPRRLSYRDLLAHSVASKLDRGAFLVGERVALGRGLGVALSPIGLRPVEVSGSKSTFPNWSWLCARLLGLMADWSREQGVSGHEIGPIALGVRCSRNYAITSCATD